MIHSTLATVYIFLMKYYFAPLEGLTYPEYRIAHSHHFDGCDAYFAPFLATGGSGVYKPSYLRKHLPDIEHGIHLIPQILSNNAEKFLELANVLSDLGYDEINLNAGCPSGTVFAKHKGSGMLLDLDSLDSFLDTVFSSCKVKVSIKTRMGVNSTDEFPEIMSIYNKYPISELIIHARSKIGMYSSPVDLNGFRESFQNAAFPVCYNGDIFSGDSLNSLTDIIPDVDCIMLGRGILSNPGLVGILNNSYSISLNDFKDFHSELIDMYLQRGLTRNYVAERMKNLWCYCNILFKDSDKLIKKLKKSKTMDEYLVNANDIFCYSSFDSNATFSGFEKI